MSGKQHPVRSETHVTDTIKMFQQHSVKVILFHFCSLSLTFEHFILRVLHTLTLRRTTYNIPFMTFSCFFLSVSTRGCVSLTDRKWLWRVRAIISMKTETDENHDTPLCQKTCANGRFHYVAVPGNSSIHMSSENIQSWTDLQEPVCRFCHNGCVRWVREVRIFILFPASV